MADTPVSTRTKINPLRKHASMQAIANVLLSSDTPEVRLEHKGESVTFSISVFGRANFQYEYDVFDHINRYWASLPEQKQNQIFTIYKDIEYGFDNIHTKTELFDYLTNKVTELMAVNDLESVHNWITFSSGVQIPSSFEAEFHPTVGNNKSREKTYTKSDYMQLVSLSVLLRCMIPIWGQYISNIRQETGNQFKEYYAFQLLNKSSVSKCVAMEKLRLYIEHNLGDDKQNPNNTINGISSEDFGYWLLSWVCIRRICLGDVRGLDPSSHLVSYIFKAIIQRIRGNDNNFENAVKFKKTEERSGPDSENKISALERYKIKTNISLGETVELEYSIRDMVDAAMKLSYKVDPEMLKRSLHTSQTLMQQRLLDPQITLLRWVFKPVISPRGLMYLPKPVIVKALGVAEAVLWARGHKYLALLCSSYPVISDKEMVISPVDSKMRVPKELSDELDRVYPFTTMASSKKVGVKQISLVARSIDTVSDNLTMFSWRSTADESMLQEVFGNTNRKIPIKPDIKLDLTRLVLEIGSRTWL